MKWGKLIKKIHFWDLPAESAVHCDLCGDYFSVTSKGAMTAKIE